MFVITRSLTLADGRIVEVLLGGNSAGYPQVFHHRTSADANHLRRLAGALPGARYTIDLRQPRWLRCADTHGWPIILPHSLPPIWRGAPQLVFVETLAKLARALDRLGVDIPECVILDHSQISTTMNTYLHILDDTRTGAISNLDGLLSS